MIVLNAADITDLESLLLRPEALVVLGTGNLDREAAALLFADWSVLAPTATLTIDTPLAWAGAVWRIGRRALTIPRILAAAEARDRGLIDDIGTIFTLGTRSAEAFDAAATLTRGRGGDLLERAEFARLFAAGIPQEGLSAFLGKRPARFPESGPAVSR